MNLISNRYIQINNSTKIRASTRNEKPLVPLSEFEFLAFCHLLEKSFFLEAESIFSAASVSLEYRDL